MFRVNYYFDILFRIFHICPRCDCKIICPFCNVGGQGYICSFRNEDEDSFCDDCLELFKKEMLDFEESERITPNNPITYI